MFARGSELWTEVERVPLTVDEKTEFVFASRLRGTVGLDDEDSVQTEYYDDEFNENLIQNLK